MSKLHEIGAELNRALLELEIYCEQNNTDEVPDELYDRITINQDELEDKLAAYMEHIAALRGKQQHYKEQSEACKARAKSLENTIGYLKQQIQAAVEEFGTPSKAGTPTLELLGKNLTVVTTKSVGLLEGATLDEQYTTSKTTVSPNKKAIKAALDSGEVVKGAFIEETKAPRYGNKSI